MAREDAVRSKHPKIASRVCQRSSACSTTERLSDHVLDSGPLSRQCALSLDRGGKPGGVTDTTLSGAISVGWKPDRLGGSRRARRRDLAGSQCDGARCRRHQPTSSDSRDATLRSRGLLCLDTLRCDSPGSARSFFVDELSRRRFNPFNLLCVNHVEGWVGTWQGEIRDLEPGIHVVSNFGDVDDDTLPIVREARDRIASLDVASPDIDELFGSLGRVCAQTDQPFPLCHAGGDYGTVSSSLVAVKADGTVAAYWHAPGPPSEVAFSPVTLSSAGRQPRA